MYSSYATVDRKTCSLHTLLRDMSLPEYVCMVWDIIDDGGGEGMNFAKVASRVGKGCTPAQVQSPGTTCTYN